MITKAPLVNPEALQEAKIVETLQTWLIGLDPSNVGKTVDNLIHSVFSTDNDYRLIQFFQNLQNAIQVRPNSIDLYVNLISLSFGQSNVISQEKLHNLIIHLFLTPKPFTEHLLSNVGSLIFLRRLIDVLHIDIPNLVEIIKSFCNSHPDMKYYHTILFCIFAPEISMVDPEFAFHLRELLDYECASGLKVALVNFNSQFETFALNDWALYKECMNSGGLPGSIVTALKTDDIEHFQEIANFPNFDMNGTIDPSVFEPCEFLQCSPTLIQFAAFHESVKIFKFLLLNGAELNKTDMNLSTLPHFVVAGGNSELIRLIEQRKCDFVGTLHIATRFFRNDLFEWLHFYYFHDLAEIHNKFGSVLHEAAASNSIHHILYCYDNCIDVNIQAIDKQTPLHVAVKNRMFDAIHLLLGTEGINPNAKDMNGMTPLHTAALFSEPELAEQILQSESVDVNITNKWGMTPLHVAAQDGNSLTVKALMERKDVDINCKDENSMTPLHYAAQDGEYETVKALLQNPLIDVHCEDSNGTTAFTYATQSHNNATIELLAPNAQESP